MPPEMVPVFVGLIFAVIVGMVIFAYAHEKKMDARRQEKAMMRGWRYESAQGSRSGFSVEGYGGSLQWRLEERRSGGKNDQRPIFFLAKDLRYEYGVFVFGNQMEVSFLQKPFMQYILKLGAKMAPNDADAARIDAIMQLKDAQAVEIPDSSSKWKYGALATHPDFALKVLGMGLQAEYDSLSLLGAATFPPSIMLSGEGLEMKWSTRSMDGEKLEIIIDSSVRIMNILNQAVKN
jgi:hypothetical protein